MRETLEDWGYVYFGVGTALAYVEVDLENHRKKTGGAIAGHGTSLIDPDSQEAKFVIAKCDEILHLTRNHESELQPIPTNIEILKANLIAARQQKPHGLEVYTNDIIDAIRRIKNDFLVLLHKQRFYYLRRDFMEFYGKPELFGPRVAKRFKAVRDDIESAGNCLALGESTACVLHLMRALEGAIHKLAKKLPNVTINPRDTWGAILGNMSEGIKKLPQATHKQQRKKDLWSECRLNLYHVKQAWRDPSMHPRRSYDEKQAKQIMDAVKVFFEQLVVL